MDLPSSSPESVSYVSRDAQDTVAASLPDLALLRVFEYVAAKNLDDLVSAGQVCRHWRCVAACDRLWRGLCLKSHSMTTQAFTRVVQFAPRLLALDVCWIDQISVVDRAIRKRALLASPCKLIRLTGVMCHRDSEWTRCLLKLHAPHLRELEVSTVDRAALHAVSTMQRLRSLRLTGWDPGLSLDLPYGREQSEEDGVLERLEVRGLPRETTIALLQANKKTLKSLTLNIGTPWPHKNNAPSWPMTCSNLDQVHSKTK